MEAIRATKEGAGMTQSITVEELSRAKRAMAFARLTDGYCNPAESEKAEVRLALVKSGLYQEMGEPTQDEISFLVRAVRYCRIRERVGL